MADPNSDGEDPEPTSWLVPGGAPTVQHALPEQTFEFAAWQGVTVVVANRRSGALWAGTEKREILRDVTGMVSAQRFVAIIGASGSGKTTFLNVLAGRRPPTQGRVWYNGVPLREVASLGQRLAYVMQQDVHLANLTCRESLQYAALLRLRGGPARQKLQRAETLLEQFGLRACADTYIGNAEGGHGLSGGERKRLAIAMELVQGAELLLLDEPTSGLDSATAEAVVQCLSALAAAGTTVVTTIHQPSSDVFMLFEQLIVMGNGRFVYQGAAADAVDYFGGFGFPCPQYCNPADFILRLLRPAPGAEKGGADLVEDLALAHARSVALPDPLLRGAVLFDDFPMTYAASVWQQFWVLLWRAFVNVRRDPYLMYARLGQTVFLGLLTGVIFWQLPNDLHGVNTKAGAFFFVLFNQAIAPVIGIIHTFPSEKVLLFREQRSGMYRLSLYYLAKILVELPVQMLFPCLFVSILYYMCGFNPDVDRFFTLMAIAVAMAAIGQGLGLLASIASDSLAVTLAVIPVLLMPFAILSGFVVQTVPFWLHWLERISFYRVAFETALVNEFNNTVLPPCDLPPPLCPRSPNAIFHVYNVDASLGHIQRNWVILVAYSLILRLMAFLILRIKVALSTD